jgi:TolA-binding protein
MRTQSQGSGEPVRSDEEKRSFERELSDLRKEVLESRNLVIKTDNLLKNLHAEIKTAVNKIDEGYRRTWFSSAVAYLCFVALASALAFVAARGSIALESARVEAAIGEKDQAKKQAEDLSAQMAKARAEIDHARSQGDRALAIYKQLGEGDGGARLKAAEELSKIERSKLTALELRILDERARAAKSDAGQAALEQGRAALRREDMKTAASELKRFLELLPESPEAASASFSLGVALFQLKDYEGASTYLERFSARGKGQKNADYGLLLLGLSQEQLGQSARATDAYRKLLVNFPASEHTQQAQQHLRNMQRAATPTPALPAAAGAPAQQAPKSETAPAPAGGARPTPPPAASPRGMSEPPKAPLAKP